VTSHDTEFFTYAEVDERTGVTQMKALRAKLSQKALQKDEKFIIVFTSELGTQVPEIQEAEEDRIISTTSYSTVLSSLHSKEL
jgi:hypothetical protein